jgi:hypothetical protein
MATLAAALLAAPDPCPKLLRLAAHLVHLWGACFVALMMVSVSSQGACAWGLPAVRHIQRLLHLLCSRRGASLHGDPHDTDAALLGVVLVWSGHRRATLHPGHQASVDQYLQQNSNTPPEPGDQVKLILRPLQGQVQQQQQQQQQQCARGRSVDSGPGPPPLGPAAGKEGPHGAGGEAPAAGAVTAGGLETDVVEEEWVDMYELAAGLALVQNQVRLHIDGLPFLALHLSPQ